MKRMKQVVVKIEIPLTERQLAKLRRAWSDHGTPNGTIVFEPRLGLVDGASTNLNVWFLTPKFSRALNRFINQTKLEP